MSNVFVRESSEATVTGSIVVSQVDLRLFAGVLLCPQLHPDEGGST